MCTQFLENKILSNYSIRCNVLSSSIFMFFSSSQRVPPHNLLQMRNKRNTIVFFFLFYTEERFYFIRSSLKLLQNFYLTHFPWRRREHRYKSKAATSSGNETQVKDTGIEIPAMQHFSKLIIDRNSVPVEMEIYYSQFLFSFFVTWTSSIRRDRRYEHVFAERLKQRLRRALSVREVLFLGHVGSRITI